MQYPFVLVVICSALLIVTSQLSENKLNVKSLAQQCDDPLQCLLESIVIPIPDFCDVVIISGNEETICLNNFACYGIDISSLPSKYTFPTSLYFGMTGVGTYCQGDYSYPGVLKPVEGSITANISDIKFDIDLQVYQDNYYLPVAVNFTSCDVNVQTVDVAFTTAALDSLAPALDQIIKGAVQSLICNVLSTLVSTNVTSVFVNELDPALESLIASGVPSQPLNLDPNINYVNWSSSFLGSIHNLLHSIDKHNGTRKIASCFTQEIFGVSIDSNAFSLDSPSKMSNLSPFLENIFSLVTNGNDSLQVDISSMDVVFLGTLGNFASASLGITSISFSGFDSIYDVAILEPSSTSGTTLSTHFSLGELSLELGLQLVLSEPDVGVVYDEEIILSLVISDVGFESITTAAFNSDLFSTIYLDQINDLSCWLTAATVLQIDSLSLVTTISKIAVEQITGSAGSLETDIVSFIDNILRLIFEGFSPLITDVIYAAIQGPVRQQINRNLNVSLNNALDLCVPHRIPQGPDIVAWENSTVINFLDNVVDFIGPEGLNQIISCATEGTGQLVVEMTSSQLILGGLDSFYNLKVLEPESSNLYSLFSAIGIGGPKPLTVTVSSLDVIDNIKQYTDSQMLSISLQDLLLSLDVFVQFDKSILSNFSVSELNSGIACPVTSFQSLNITSITGNVRYASIAASLNDVNHNATGIINDLFEVLFRPKKLKEINNNLQQKLIEKEAVCTGQEIPLPSAPSDGSSAVDKLQSALPNYYPPSHYIPIIGLIMFSISIALTIVITCGIEENRRYFYDQNAVKDSNALSTPLLKVEGDIYKHQRDNVGSSNYWLINAFANYKLENTLVGSKKLPLILRLLVPSLIMLCIGLFVVSNFDPEGTVSVELLLTVGPLKISPEPLFVFGLINSVVDMWQAGVYPLSVLILAFSSLWPYIKLAMMLSSWLLPTEILNLSRRDSLLRFLDMYGKWSLLDIYVMIIMMCAFQFKLDILPGITAYSYVVPLWSFYSFLLATYLSLILGHIIIACHRHATDDDLHDMNMDSSEASKSESLLSHSFKIRNSYTKDLIISRDFPDKSEPIDCVYVTPTHYATFLVLLISIFTILLLIIGIYLNSFEIHFEGLTGFLLRDAANIKYSLYDVGIKFPEGSGGRTDYDWLIWMQITYFFVSVATPIATICMALLLFIVPLPFKWQWRFMVIAEVFNSWTGLDVFCLAILATLLEIEQFAQFIVGDKCDGVNVLLAKYFDVLLQGDDKCFDMIATVVPTSFAIFIAAIFWYIVGTNSLAICRAALFDRKIHLKEQLNRDTLSLNIGPKPLENVIEESKDIEIIEEYGESVESGSFFKNISVCWTKMSANTIYWMISLNLLSVSYVYDAEKDPTQSAELNNAPSGAMKTQMDDSFLEKVMQR